SCGQEAAQVCGPVGGHVDGVALPGVGAIEAQHDVEAAIGVLDYLERREVVGALPKELLQGLVVVAAVHAALLCTTRMSVIIGWRLARWGPRGHQLEQEPRERIPVLRLRVQAQPISVGEPGLHLRKGRSGEVEAARADPLTVRWYGPVLHPSEWLVPTEP